MLETSWQDNPMLLRVLIGLCIASLPALGWVGRMVFGMAGRLTKVETVIEERTPLITEMQKIQITDGNRLVLAEASLVTLGKMQETTDRNYAALSVKLDILPRIDESLAHLARVCATIVPRDEWDLNNKLYDERMKRFDTQSK